MKTADEWRTEFLTSINQTLIFDTGVVETIQEEAWKAGMTLAAEIAGHYLEHFPVNSASQNIAGLIKEEIEAVRNNKIKPF